MFHIQTRQQLQDAIKYSANRFRSWQTSQKLSFSTSAHPSALLPKQHQASTRASPSEETSFQTACPTTPTTPFSMTTPSIPPDVNHTTSSTLPEAHLTTCSNPLLLFQSQQLADGPLPPTFAFRAASRTGGTCQDSKPAAQVLPQAYT